MNTLGPRLVPSSKLEIPVGAELQGSSPKQIGAKPIENKKEFAKVLAEKKDPTQTRADDTRPRKTETQEPVKINRRQKSGERETAMLNFMDSMESEFGVTPVRMLEAMAVLDHEDLARTPEESASAVIDNLELAPEDEPEAMELYMSFVSQWQNLDQAKAKPDAIPMTADPRFYAATAGEFKPAMVPGEVLALNGQIGAQTAAPTKVINPREQLNASIDKMNDKFFLKTNASVQSLPGMDPSLMEIPTEIISEFPMEGEARLLAGNDLGFRLPSEMDGTMPVTPVPMPAPPGLTLATVEGEMKPLAEEGDAPKKDIESLLREIAGLPALPKAEAPVASAVKAEAAFFPLGAATGLTAAAVVGGESEGSSDLSSEDGEARSDNGGRPEQNQPLNADFMQTIRTGENRAVAGAAVATESGMFSETGDVDSKQDIQALKDQAQLMIKDGGGEAKIRMNTEGMGEVHLKVAVQNGKVNVEIGTDNKEAKQLIESSISDLRMGLAQHKLSVDNVKVDVGQGNTDSQQQQQQRGLNFGQDMNRDQARQMMSNFRDEMASRRDPFFEMSGIKAYGRKRAEPAPIAAAPNTVGGRREGRGDRMNLIA